MGQERKVEMSKSNETVLDSRLYARLLDVQMSESERKHAVEALLQAEQIADAILWVKEKIADIGHAFLKPSLRI